MKHRIFPFIFLWLCVGLHSRAQQTTNPLPSEDQLKWQDNSFYLFMHFGPNTFTDLEWGKGSEKEEVFQPDALDCRQWCRIAKAAGASGIIITAKHHDGFCLWPSKYSTHTVAQSSWKNGKGDVLRELSDACREAGLSFGVYLSPWDRNHPSYGTPAYNDVFISMMKEVAKSYGPFFEFWWDGANGEGPNGKKQEYDWDRFIKTIREVAPHTVVFSDIGPDIRWVGNEKGFVGTTNWNLLDTAGFHRGLGAPPNDTLNQGNVFGKNWIPAECDVSIRPGWFYHPAEDSLVKSPDSLFDIYLKSVGRGANLLLNVPPNRHGLISAPDSAALMEFARLRKEGFTDLLRSRKNKMTFPGDPSKSFEISGGPVSFDGGGKNNNTLEVRFAEEQKINAIQLSEDLQQGQRVISFYIELHNGKQLVFQRGYTTIGHQRIISFPEVTVTNIRVVIMETKLPPKLFPIEVYNFPEKLIRDDY